MPDEGDLAQASEAEFLEAQLQARRRARELEGKILGPCANAPEGCKKLQFFTDKGTRCRFCRECLAEFQREQAELRGP